MAIHEYTSPLPDVDLPSTDLISFLFSNARSIPANKPIFIDAITGISRTYGDIQKRTRSLATGLRSKIGVKSDEVVGFISPNTIDYAITCFGIIGSGATVSPVNVASTAGELRSQLQTSGAKYLIAHSTLLPIVKEAVKETQVTTLIQADGLKDAEGNMTAESMAATCEPRNLVKTGPELVQKRLALLCFSSGTTGKAKGVMTTHYNLTSNVLQWLAHLSSEWSGNTPAVAFLPLSHIYGFTAYLCMSLASGTTVVVLPRFDLEFYLSSVEKHRSEVLLMVPPVALLLAKDPRVKNYDLKCVKRIMSAAAPLSTELALAVEARFQELFGTKLYCYQAWGMTETSPLGSITPPDRLDKRATVGCITPNMAYRIVDPETLVDVEGPKKGGASAAGEIWCRGPNVTRGYYRNEEATAESFATDEKGQRWFRTGDIGTIDDEAYFTIVDRIKEMIKYKGLQVIPSELEGKLLQHPFVADACVVGNWVEEQATELPVAFVVLSQDAKGKSEKAVVENIHQWLNSKVANHKRLRGGIRIVDAIPKSPSGKILRRQAKEQLKQTRVAAKL